MIRKLNRIIQDFLRPKRLAIGRFIWDKKNIDSSEIVIDGKIDMNKVKSILFLRYDGKIGDMVINTLMFREIKKRYPNTKIGVVARESNKDIIVNNPNVDKIYLFEKNRDEIKKLAKAISTEKYDVLVDFSEMLRVYQMMFINLCRAKCNVGLNKKSWKLFDISIENGEDFTWKDHITERYKAYLQKFGIKGNIDVKYDIYGAENQNKQEIEDIKEKIVILNPYGASKHKTFSLDTLEKIIEYLKKYSVKIVILYYGDKYKEVRELKKFKNVYIPKTINGIQDSIEYIKKSILVITPDTSIVHIASALDRPNISVYPPKGGEYGVDHLVWAPKSQETNVIFCKDKKDKYEEIDINTFSFSEMTSVIDKIVKEVY